MLTPAERGLLRDVGFRRLLTARTFVLFGNVVGPIGLAFGVLRLPGGSGAELALLLFARGVAQIAMLLFGGVLADRMSKSRVMLVSDAVSGITGAGMAALILSGHNVQWLLLVLSVVSGAATGAFLPASTGIIPEVVAREAIQPANAILRVSANSANVVGAAIAGGLIVWIGPGGALAVNALMYLLSAAALAGLPRGTTAMPDRPGVLRELVDGWNAFRSYQWVWIIVAEFALINLLFNGAIRVLGPVEADRVPHGATIWAFALGAQAAGLFVGSAVAMRLKPRYPLRVAAYCTAGLAAPLLLLGLDIPLLWMALGLFVAGLCADVFTVLWETSLQSWVAPEALSRVSSYDALGSFALMPLGFVLAAPVAGTSYQQPALLLGALIIAGLGALALLVPSIRMLPSAVPRGSESPAFPPSSESAASGASEGEPVVLVSGVPEHAKQSA